jgi:hypothetical protein
VDERKILEYRPLQNYRVRQRRTQEVEHFLPLVSNSDIRFKSQNIDNLIVNSLSAAYCDFLKMSALMLREQLTLCLYHSEFVVFTLINKLSYFNKSNDKVLYNFIKHIVIHIYNFYKRI